MTRPNTAAAPVEPATNENGAPEPDKKDASRPAGAPQNAEPAASKLSLISSQAMQNSPRRRSKLGTVLASEAGNLHFRLRIVNSLLFFCPQHCFGRVRTRLYRFCGVSIGHGSMMIGNLTFSGGGPIFSRLRIGRNCILNSPLYLDLNADITIGDEVCIGHHAVLITTDHELGDREHRCGLTQVKPITIGNGCWIGARATILPGVTLGEGCVVSAGAVVSNDVPPNKVVAGNPARPVKSMD
jgi:maltose O-acetyltransferase